MEDVGSRRMAGAEDARMGCENVGTSATSLPLEIINPVKSTKSYSLLLHTLTVLGEEGRRKLVEVKVKSSCDYDDVRRRVLTLI